VCPTLPSRGHIRWLRSGDEFLLHLFGDLRGRGWSCRTIRHRAPVARVGGAIPRDDRTVREPVRGLLRRRRRQIPPRHRACRDQLPPGVRDRLRRCPHSHAARLAGALLGRRSTRQAIWPQPCVCWTRAIGSVPRAAEWTTCRAVRESVRAFDRSTVIGTRRWSACLRV